MAPQLVILDKVYEAPDYICADKKKTSSSSLRSRADEEDASSAKEEPKLKDSAETVHDWLGRITDRPLSKSFSSV